MDISDIKFKHEKLTADKDLQFIYYGSEEQYDLNKHDAYIYFPREDVYAGLTVVQRNAACTPSTSSIPVYLKELTHINPDCTICIFSTGQRISLGKIKNYKIPGLSNWIMVHGPNLDSLQEVA